MYAFIYMHFITLKKLRHSHTVNYVLLKCNKVTPLMPIGKKNHITYKNLQLKRYCLC